jgi:hypothetical protein
MKNGFMKPMVIVLLLVSGARASAGVGAALVAGAGIAAAVHECVIS